MNSTAVDSESQRPDTESERRVWWFPGTSLSEKMAAKYLFLKKRHKEKRLGYAKLHKNWKGVMEQLILETCLFPIVFLFQ